MFLLIFYKKLNLIALFRRIMRWGVKEEFPDYLKRRIILCNQLAMSCVVLALLVIVCFPSISLRLVTPFLVLGGYSLSLILNRIHYDIPARFIVSVFPTLALTLQLILLMPAGVYILAGRVVILAGLSFPLVLFDIREKWKLWLAIGFITACFLGIEPLNDAFRIGEGTFTNVHNTLLRHFVLAISALILILAFWYQQIIVKKAEDQSARLLDETLEQKEEISTTLEVVSHQHIELTNSVVYARRIQEAILPPLKTLTDLYPDSFVLYLPKDVVSGDFYFIHRKKDELLIGAFDCTGHGVPGAFMAVLGNTLLGQILHEATEIDPAEVLDALDLSVRSCLKQFGGGSESRDGMDASIVVLRPAENQLLYAGANNPLYYFRRGEHDIISIKADKRPVGGGQYEAKPFTLTKLNLSEIESFYLFTDGFADQFGGQKGRKYMYKNFRRLLTRTRPFPVDEIRQTLCDELRHWQGDNKQVDDVLVLGVKLNNKNNLASN